MKILITGATSYLGMALVNDLVAVKNTQVFAIVRASSDVEQLSSKASCFKVNGSFGTIERAVKETQPDIVIHLAAAFSMASEQIPSLIEANITLATMLLEAMAKNGCHCFIHTGTFWEEMEKTQVYNPVNLYAATKRAFLDIAKFYCKAYAIKIINLRLFGVYGPYDPRKKFFSLLRESFVSRMPLKFTPGEQIMDLIYIDDVVNAYRKAIAVLKQSKTNWQEIELGTGQGMKLREIVAAYESYIKQSLDIEWGALPYRSREVMNRVADISKAKEVLGWEPQYSIKNGIKKMLEIEGVAK